MREPRGVRDRSLLAESTVDSASRVAVTVVAVVLLVSDTAAGRGKGSSALSGR